MIEVTLNNEQILAAIRAAKETGGPIDSIELGWEEDHATAIIGYTAEGVVSASEKIHVAEIRSAVVDYLVQRKFGVNNDVVINIEKRDTEFVTLKATLSVLHLPR